SWLSATTGSSASPRSTSPSSKPRRRRSSRSATRALSRSSPPPTSRSRLCATSSRRAATSSSTGEDSSCFEGCPSTATRRSGAPLGRARSQNARGHLLGHVCDLGLSGADPNVRIYQTRERQSFHTDSCDVVGLLCIREAKRGGDSLLVSALSIYNELLRIRPD